MSPKHSMKFKNNYSKLIIYLTCKLIKIVIHRNKICKQNLLNIKLN